jgi:hypothetical protein
MKEEITSYIILSYEALANRLYNLFVNSQCWEQITTKEPNKKIQGDRDTLSGVQ